MSHLKVRVDSLNVLGAIDKKKKEQALVLIEGALQTEERAHHFLYDHGGGVFCKAEGTENLKTGEILSLIPGDDETTPSEIDKNLQTYKLKYESEDKKVLTLECTFRGDDNQSKLLIANFFTILSFSFDDGTFSPGADSEED